ncbi:helix-turn-helix domain-containing protein [Streptococcus sanguinis]|uniref:HTH-type transcriptional regulator n=1 Tax=Streptococcus sanguinis TaxID=1305 RepID=A0A0B7GSS2_STRSA|nr:helix-turn-helix transcriptional regulator [Streptococcus sanguinis]CEL91278.1 HTH-type transcriptional regulator [Streptococcus sanguinis]
MPTIKNRLKELRTKKGITQDKLATELNDGVSDNEKLVSKMVISNWENNKHAIKPEKAQQLADYFKVSVAYLLGYNDEIMTFDSGEEFEKEKIRTLNTIFLSELRKSQEKDAIQIDVLAAIKFLESALEKIKKHSKNVKNSYITDLQKALDTLSNLADGLAGKRGSNDEK